MSQRPPHNPPTGAIALNSDQFIIASISEHGLSLSASLLPIVI
jgi:hypothetical protein